MNEVKTVNLDELLSGIEKKLTQRIGVALHGQGRGSSSEIFGAWRAQVSRDLLPALEKVVTAVDRRGHQAEVILDPHTGVLKLDFYPRGSVERIGHPAGSVAFALHTSDLTVSVHVKTPWPRPAGTKVERARMPLHQLDGAKAQQYALEMVGRVLEGLVDSGEIDLGT